MAFTQEFRKTTVDWLRTYIGDEDRLMFPDDGDLDIYLRSRVGWSVTTELLTASKNHFYSFTPRPVLDLEVITGTSGSNYRIDEVSKHVLWTSGSGSSEPADQSTIEVSYINVDFWGAVRDVLIAIATDRAKLAIKAKAEGMSHDLTKLRSELMKQAMSISTVQFWEQK